MKWYLSSYIFALSCNMVFCQSSAPCSAPEYRQFDFWLGDWNVYDTLGNQVGESEIHRIQDSCAIQENWRSANLTGTSYNYFRTADATWHQIYLDKKGTVLELSGKFMEGKMVLESEYFVRNNTEKKHRITWGLDDKNHVVQKWDVVNRNG